MVGVPFLKLPRDIVSHYLYFAEKYDKWHAYQDLYLLANWADSSLFVRGVKVDVKRGQVARSIETIMERWKWSRNKVEGFLQMLEKNGDIVRQKNNVITIITMNLYDTWFQNGNPNDNTESNPNDNTESNPNDNTERLHKIRNNNKEKEKKEKKEKKKIPQTPQSNKFDSGNELNFLSDSYSSRILFFVGDNEFRVTSEMIQSFSKRFRKPYQAIFDELGGLRGTLLSIGDEIYIGEESEFLDFIKIYLADPYNYFSSQQIKEYFTNKERF